MLLGTGQVVIRVPDTAIEVLTRLVPFFCGYLVQKYFPLVCDTSHLFILLLFVQRVAVVRIDIVSGGGLRVGFLDVCKALFVALDCFVRIAHVDIDIAHGIVGQCHSVFVLALCGILVHAFYLLQPHVDLAHEDIGVHYVHPGLVIVFPAFLALMVLQVDRTLMEQGVVQVVIVKFAKVMNAATAFCVHAVVSIGYHNQNLQDDGKDGFFHAAKVQRK